MILEYGDTETRTDEDRTPEALAFIAEIVAVCEKHGFTIEHQDSQGSFIVERGTGHGWFAAASEHIRPPVCPVCGSAILPSEGRETEHGVESRCVACGEFSPRREWGFLD